MMRWIGIVFAVLVLVVAAGVYYLTRQLDSIVAAQIESHGSAITGTAVGVGGVDIALRQGRGTLRSVSVASPAGYQAKNTFQLGEITVDIDPSSVTGSPIVLDEVVIAAPEVHFEVDAQARSNVQQILDHARAVSPSEPEAKESGEPVHLRIKSFQFRDGKIQADTRALGGKTYELEMPALGLRNVGGSAGAPPDQIAKAVMTAYAQSVVKRVAKSQVQGQLDTVIDKQLGGEAGKAAKGLLDRVME
jgi:uncharacterized protein involved in outer membrane biogenesis